MEEIWKEVYYKGKYVGKKVSNTGKLVCDNGRVCLLADNGAGYLTYHVTMDNSSGKAKPVRLYAHRLVAEYFLPNPDNLPQVNHKDCNKANNHVDNLEWTTRGANIKHAHESGRMEQRTENADIEILSVEQVIELYTAVKRDGVGISVKAREMGLPRTTASSIMNKRSRTNVTDAIDSYLTQSNFVKDRMLTREDLNLVAEGTLIHRPGRKKGVKNKCNSKTQH